MHLGVKVLPFPPTYDTDSLYTSYMLVRAIFTDQALRNTFPLPYWHNYPIDFREYWNQMNAFHMWNIPESLYSRVTRETVVIRSKVT